MNSINNFCLGLAIAASAWGCIKTQPPAGQPNSDAASQVDTPTDADAPIDVPLADASTPEVCLLDGPLPSPGEPCVKVGEVSCSNEGSRNFGRHDAPYCLRPRVVRCEPANGTSRWVSHATGEIVSPGNCDPYQQIWGCVPIDGQAVIGRAAATMDTGGCSARELGEQRCAINAECKYLDPQDPLNLPIFQQVKSDCVWAVTALPMWVPLVCKGTLYCLAHTQGKYYEEFQPKCVADTPTTFHCATTCEEIGEVTPK